MIKIFYNEKIPNGFKGKLLVVFKDEIFIESYQFIRKVNGFNSQTSKFSFDGAKESCFEWPRGGLGREGDKIK